MYGIKRGVIRISAVLYSTGCPRCNILQKKLESKHIDYTVNNNEDEMISVGMTEAPSLFVDGKLLNFSEAIEWVNSR